MNTISVTDMSYKKRGITHDKPFNESILVQLMIIFCLVICLGFPGNLTEVIGERVAKWMEYIGFGIEIMVILLSSATDWKEIELLRLEKKFGVMYFYVVFIFVTSMLVTAYPSDQFISCLRLMVTLLFAIWMVQHYTLDKIVALTAYAQGVFIVITILFLMRYPGMSYESSSHFTNAFTGLYYTKNACATQLVFGIIITVFMIRQRFRARSLSIWWIALLFVQIGLLMLCQATGAVLSLLVALLPLFFLKKMRLQLGLIYIVGNVLFLFLMLTFMPLFADLIIALGKDPTLTGRIPMWNRIIEMMLESKAILGYGYGMFWRNPSAVRGITSAFDMKENPFMATLSTGAHNVILEMWLNSGLAGIAVFFFMIFTAFNSVKFMSEDKYQFCAAILAYLTMNGLTERCLGGNYDYKMFIIFVLMAIGYDAIPQRQDAARLARIRALKEGAHSESTGEGAEC